MSLSIHFPKLGDANHKITSEQTIEYNCIAWAAGESKRWWDIAAGYYWPEGMEKSNKATALIEVFRQLGYTETGEPNYEQGFEKVAIYAAFGEFTHVARQLKNGKWTSKLGDLEDIEHCTLDVLEGSVYGTLLVVLKRPLK